MVGIGLSYRIKVENRDGLYYQVLGNNDYSKELIRWVRESGWDVDEEGNFYDFELEDITKFLGIIINFIRELPNDPYKLVPMDEDRKWEVSIMVSAYENAYIGEVSKFVRYFEGDLVKEYVAGKGIVYRVKEGSKLLLSAY